MQVLQNISDRKYSVLNWLEFSLIILSSVLLGIWAAANTIALRNILLVLGALLSTIYFYQLHRQNQLKHYFGLRNSIPSFCIIGLFIWVLAHCFLFPTDYSAQINELKSTWLRSLLAAVVGLATGIAINRNPTRIYWLWIGMTFTFLCLFGQYVEDAWQQQKLFTENAMKYLFLGKVNGVLMGNILIAGLFGSFSDTGFNRIKNKTLVIASVFLIISLVLFSYVFILESRNGIAITFILVLVWLVYLFKRTYKTFSAAGGMKKFLAIVFLMFIISLLIYKHLERTPQWFYLLEDIQISSRVDRLKAWQHPMDEGPPTGSGGRSISANTYLRTAWFVAGIKLIPEAGLGHGVLHEAFQRALDRSQYSGARVKSTHSAFLDFFLSFGLLGGILFFLPIPLIIIKNLGAGGSSVARWIGFVLAILLMLTESTRQHSIEILFFWICTLQTLGSDYE